MSKKYWELNAAELAEHKLAWELDAAERAIRIDAAHKLAAFDDLFKALTEIAQCLHCGCAFFGSYSCPECAAANKVIKQLKAGDK